MKHIPFVGEHLYVRQRTGNMWVDEVHRPYTVKEILGENRIIIQAAKCNFPEPRYYDTLPTSIEEDTNGRTMMLRWSEKKQRWQESPHYDSYPYFGVFGEWDYQPYLN